MAFTVRVKDGMTGYYEHAGRYGKGVDNRKEGDVFVLHNEKLFSSVWMEKIESAPKESDEPVFDKTMRSFKKKKKYDEENTSEGDL